jgi:hypothetical protein
LCYLIDIQYKIVNIAGRGRKIKVGLQQDFCGHGCDSFLMQRYWSCGYFPILKEIYTCANGQN